MVNQRAFRDRYGFLFWLRWILWFAASFVLSAVSWTFLMKIFFGEIRGGELTLTWVVSVFGTWFILVIPFMRKKEQIWKRLNEDQEKAVDAWLLGVSLFIGLFILSAFFWSVKYRNHILSHETGFYPSWAKAVFGSWLALVLPFLIFMYRKADQIFKTALDRQTYAPKFQTHWLDNSKRLLPEDVSKKIKTMKPVLRQGHLVTVLLKDGRRIENVFVRNSAEMAGVYDQKMLDFDATDIVDAEISDSEELPIFDESKWVRFDIQEN